jgi:hypothetical protein
LELNEVQVTSEKQMETGHLDTSPKKIFSTKLKLNKDLITTLPKPNIKNSVTHFVDLELKMLGVVISPP